MNLDVEALSIPLKRKAPTMYFVNSMSDLFHENVPDDFIDEVFGVMGACEDAERGHVFQILTKRAQRLRDYMLNRGHKAWNARRLGTEAYPPRNVWLGVSVEDQQRADARIPHLLRTAAVVRFLSCEPLLGPVDLSYYLPQTPIAECEPEMLPYYNTHFALHWIIVGGESGPGARPMDPNWVRALRDQCVEAGVPFFFKQHGAWQPIEPMADEFPTCGSVPENRENATMTIHDWDDYRYSVRVGKEKAGRLLDGREWNEMPTMEKASVPG